MPSSISQSQNKPKRIVCFDLDDTTRIFDWLINNPTATSIFDNSILAWMKTMHDTYGCKFMNPCYYLFTNIPSSNDMSDVPATWKSEFEANADWLRFSLHSYAHGLIYPSTAIQATHPYGTDPDWPDRYNPIYIRTDFYNDDYNQMRNELTRICGAAAHSDTVMVSHVMSNSFPNMQSIRADVGQHQVWIAFRPTDYAADPDKWGWWNAEHNKCWNFDYLWDVAPYSDVVTDLLNGYHYNADYDLEMIPYSFVPELTASYSSDIDAYLQTLGTSKNSCFYVVSHEIEIATDNTTAKNNFIAAAQWANNNGYTWEFPNRHTVRAANLVGSKNSAIRMRI